MLAWLIVLLCVGSGGWAAAALGPDIAALVGTDLLLVVLSKLGFADLCQVSYLSKSFHTLADQVIKGLHVIRHNGSTCLDYTKILHELDALVQGAVQDGDISKANAALGSSLHFACIQSVLQARFGYCIRHAIDKLPEFYLHDIPLDILNDERRISVLPYALDQTKYDSQWIHFIRGLIASGRVDLLNAMAFPKITPIYFYQLLGVLLPKSVLDKAVDSLMKAEPDSELAKLFEWAGFGDQKATLPEDCTAPLFFLQYWRENSIAIPDGCIFTFGLEECSISFWMDVLAKEAGEAKEVLDLVLKHGSRSTKCLASAFYGPVRIGDLQPLDVEVHQAMLIRFRFSPICNEHVVQNYNSMLGQRPEFLYHCACALLDCGQYGLVDRIGFGFLSYSALELLIGKVHRLGDGSLQALSGNLVEHYVDKFKLLKLLLQRKAEDSHVQLVWGPVERASQLHLVADRGQCQPLDMLRRFVSERDISMDTAQQVLTMLDGFPSSFGRVPKEARVLYTFMFWEPSEAVIAHFLDLVPADYQIDFSAVKSLLLLTQYSSELCGKLVSRLGELDHEKHTWLLEFRPDLVKKFEL